MTLGGRLHAHRHQLVPLALGAVVLVVLAVFWRDAVSWFSGQPRAPRGSAQTMAAQAGPFQLEVALAPDPPRARGNALRLRVTEGDAAVTDAQVTVSYRMPPMGSMQEMRGRADVTRTEDGTYDAKFDLPMAGSWTLTVAVQRQDRAGEATFNLTVGTSGLTATGQSGTAGSTTPTPTPPLPSHVFDAASLAHLRAAFAGYEQVRSLLARDTVDELAARALDVRSALEAAAPDTVPPVAVAQALSGARDVARQLGEAKDLAAARRSFGELSMRLSALAASDPRLAEGLHFFTCPMAEGFQEWFQRAADVENPYMGQSMLACGERLDRATSTVDVVPHAHPDDDETAHYTCSMHPSVRQQTDGACPICGMDLLPVTKGEVASGTIRVDDDRRQRIGVRTAPVARRHMTLPIRAVGQVRYDETRLSEVNLRMSGWVKRLEVSATGQRVRKGQMLFTLYSPELYAAQLEYLGAVRRGGDATAATLTSAARQRLHLLGMSEAQLAELVRRDEAWEHVPILAPASGFVLEKNVIEGARVEAGAVVYRIADLSHVWIDAEVYEADLPHVRVGQRAAIGLPNVPGQSFEGRVDFVYPTFEGATRTGRVRVELANRDLALKPNMYATVALTVDLGERLVIPESAVIYTGPRRLVFVDLGEGRLRPRLVQLGVHAAGLYEVTGGLVAGEVVVTSGNFLIAAESRIRSAAAIWEDDDAAR